MKYINFKRYKSYINTKYTNLKRFNFYKLFQFIGLRKYISRGLTRYLDIIRHNISYFYKNISFKSYRNLNFNFYRNLNLKFYKNINLKSHKSFISYISLIIFFSFLLYTIIPVFYNYEKSKIEKLACKGINVQCKIGGKISYTFFPSPRINIKNITVADKQDENIISGNLNEVTIKIYYKNLLNKEKLNFKTLEIQNSELNINLKNLEAVRKLFFSNFILEPIKIKKTKINFFDGDKFLTNIKDTSFVYSFRKKKENFKLKGTFLNDSLIVKYKKKINGNKISKKLVANLVNANLSTKIELLDFDQSKNLTTSKVLVKKDKNILSGIVEYKDNKIILDNTNLGNIFLEGKVNGYLKFKPFFDFNLDVSLNSLNFNKIYNILVNLDEASRKQLLKINKKFNGKVNLSINKIFSKNTLIKSLESRIRFLNGNIFFDQAILNLGKLGATDFTGVIDNDNKFSIFKFENNIFVDNKKRFFNKFGVYNKKEIPSSVSMTGVFDLTNLILRIDEIFQDTKFPSDDVKYIEESFNEILLENGYETLFNYIKLKNFVKAINPEQS